MPYQERLMPPDLAFPGWKVTANNKQVEWCTKENRVAFQSLIIFALLRMPGTYWTSCRSALRSS